MITKVRNSVGLGFLPDEARHGFLVVVTNGSADDDLVYISEHLGDNLGNDYIPPSPSCHDKAMRVVIDRKCWLAIAPTFWKEALRLLHTQGIQGDKFEKSPEKPIAANSSLGKELCVLCWAAEQATQDDIQNILINWLALDQAERWWLYRMTVATTGQAMQKGIGWRKALYFAMSSNNIAQSSIHVVMPIAARLPHLRRPGAWEGRVWESKTSAYDEQAIIDVDVAVAFAQAKNKVDEAYAAVKSASANRHAASKEYAMAETAVAKASAGKAYEAAAVYKAKAVDAYMIAGVERAIAAAMYDACKKDKDVDM